MSRINDALKRASEKDRRSQARPESPPPTAPAPTQAQTKRGYFLWLVISFLLVCAVKFGSRALAVRQYSPHPMIASTPVEPVSVPVPALEPKPVTARTVFAPEPTPVPVAAPAPPAFPAVHLQAIFYTAANPRALINGATCQMGDEVSGVRVVKIEQGKVTLQWNGETRVLTMQN